MNQETRAEPGIRAGHDRDRFLARNTDKRSRSCFRHGCATLAGGRRYDNDYCFVFEFDGDRVRRVREYMDTQRGAALFAGRTPPGED